MGHNVVTLMSDSFYTRTILGSTLLNVGGETHDVDIVTEDKYRRSQFKAYKKGTKELLATFCAWHMHGGPDLYQISGISMNGHGDGTLIVRPTLEAWQEETQGQTEDDE